MPDSFRHVVLCFCLVLIPAGPAAGATTLVFDDFTEGGFSVSDADVYQRETGLTLPIASDVSRDAHGYSSAPWSATSTTANGGSMTYNPNTLGLSAIRNDSFEISYRHAGGFDFSGYTAFSISITNLTGRGQFIISNSLSPSGTPVDVTGTGELVVPFALMNTTAPLDSISWPTFRFTGQSNDFTITVNRIALVPEPSALALAAAGVFAVLRRSRTIREWSSGKKLG